VTSTAPASTLTSTATQISTSTVTQTNSAIPSWAYAAMAILLLAGLAVGYVVKRPPTRQN
jgi:protein-S-isoprenylcysteine O-methyltransferase Ste14